MTDDSRVPFHDFCLSFLLMFGDGASTSHNELECLQFWYRHRGYKTNPIYVNGARMRSVPVLTANDQASKAWAGFRLFCLEFRVWCLEQQSGQQTTGKEAECGSPQGTET